MRCAGAFRRSCRPREVGGEPPDEKVSATNVTPAEPRTLVATDFRDTSDEALTQADACARAVKGSLGVCRVTIRQYVDRYFPPPFANYAAEQRAADERARAAVVERVIATTGRSPSSFEVLIEHGTAYAAIVQSAETWRATLLVVGARVRAEGALAGLFGGVVEKVVRYAHCPVLVARPIAHRGLVLCATDLSAPSLPAVEAAVAEARLRGAKLVVLHAIDQGTPLASVSHSEGITPLVLAPELLHDLRKRAHAEIDAVLTRLRANAECTVVEGHPAATILEYVDEWRPELVVVGARGRTGLARVFLGSVAEHVVRAAKTSVLVVRLAS
jgi:nucleotide-binding universal stress UspA family protein